MNPLEYWRRSDAPDRQGIAEVRYVEGLYAMWDELRARHPGLLIDNCSSGGRRIDLETCARAVPFWRSDTSCSPGHADWNQAQTYGLGLYIPLHMACGWTPEPYDFRSSATAGAIAQWDYLAPGFPADLGRATLAEAKENRRYWYGDFWPLTDCSLSTDVWMAYQFHRPDLDAGLVLTFRRGKSRYTGLSISLRGIDPQRDYVVELTNERAASGDRSPPEKPRVISGRELAGDFELRIPKKGTSMILRYRPAR